jgi:ribosomal protein S18 acetylase RimI-like enzyme
MKQVQVVLILILPCIINHCFWSCDGLVTPSSNSNTNRNIKDLQTVKISNNGINNNNNNNNNDSQIQQKKQIIKKIGNDFHLRELVSSDAEFVNSNWPYSNQKTIHKIRKLIQSDTIKCCLGIEKIITNNKEKEEYNDQEHEYGDDHDNDNDNHQNIQTETQKQELVACILRYHNGALGMLHVDEQYRRCGLGKILVQEASKALVEHELPCFTFIVDNNIASENLFTKLGWVKDNPNGKKGTGKRRAKRKWTKYRYQC